MSRVEDYRAKFFVALVSSNSQVSDACKEQLYKAGFEVSFFVTPEALVARSFENRYDVIIVDEASIDWSVEKIMEAVLQQRPQTLFLLLCHTIKNKTARQILRDVGLIDQVEIKRIGIDLVWAVDSAIDRLYKSEQVKESAIEKRLNFSEISSELFDSFAEAESRKDLIQLMYFYLKDSGCRVVYFRLILPKYIFTPTEAAGFEKLDLSGIGLQLEESEISQFSELLDNMNQFSRFQNFLRRIFVGSDYIATKSIYTDGMCDGVLVVLGDEARIEGRMEPLFKIFEVYYQRMKLRMHIEKNSWLNMRTGLMGKRYFLERFDQELKRGRRINLPVGVLRIEIGNRMHIEKRFGSQHLQVISESMAALIKQSSRTHDLATEMASGVFLTILPHTNLDGAAIRGERIRRILKTSLRSALGDQTLEFYVGVAEYPKSGRNSEQLLIHLKEASQASMTRNGETICLVKDNKESVTDDGNDGNSNI